MDENKSLALYNANGCIAVAKAHGSHYLVESPLTGQRAELDRDVDFGVIPGTKRPSLYKSGAEKIIGAYGLMPRYDIISMREEYDGKTGNGFFHYVIKCGLYKGGVTPQGVYTEVEYANGFGSANTLEKRNGMNSAFNSANSTLKMAEKRALVAACMAVAGLSSLFTQDIEDETSVKSDDMLQQSPASRINAKQRGRIFDVAAQVGMTTEQTRKWLSAEGYSKTTDITVEQFESIIEKLKGMNA